MRSLLFFPLLALGFAACGTDLDTPGAGPGENGFGPASVLNYGAPLSESELFGNWLFCNDASCTSFRSGLGFAPDHKLFAVNPGRAVPTSGNAVDVGTTPGGLSSGLGGLGGLGGSLFCQQIGTYSYSRGSIQVSAEGRISVATISKRQGKVRIAVPFDSSPAASSGNLSSRSQQTLFAVKTDLECQGDVSLDITPPPPQTGGGATNGPAGP